jgi:1,4-dihydroxy-6-naphthoate synthase
MAAKKTASSKATGGKKPAAKAPARKTSKPAAEVPETRAKGAPDRKAPAAAKEKPAAAKPSKAKPKTKAPAAASVETAEAERAAAGAVVAEPAAALEVAPRPAKPPPLPPRRADGTITLAHSPDADDAFMFYALASGQVDTEARRYDHVLRDIQTLNEQARVGTYDVTAISFHAWPYVRRNYALLTCGASFGDGYGPILVSKTLIRPAEVEGLTIAIPGEWTTAALLVRLWLGRSKVNLVPVPFDKIPLAVRSGMVRAGVLIHEAQLTYKAQGLVRVVDFGQWWSQETEGLPLPLGGNAVRRDVPKEQAAKIALDLKRSIAYALGHREEALTHALQYARGLSRETADKFVGLYVNDLTLDYGERGRQAVAHLYQRAHEAGLLPEAVVPEFVE